MVEHFPLLRQSATGNACFPTCVRAVLLWYGERATQDEVSEWCQESPRGCVLDLAIDGLRNEGFDLEELIGRTRKETEEQLRNQFSGDEDVPIIVTLKNILSVARIDHAVVVTNIQRVESANGEQEIVEYMDPLVGALIQDESDDFWEYWLYAGQRAFILRP